MLDKGTNHTKVSSKVQQWTLTSGHMYLNGLFCGCDWRFSRPSTKHMKHSHQALGVYILRVTAIRSSLFSPEAASSPNSQQSEFSSEIDIFHFLFWSEVRFVLRIDQAMSAAGVPIDQCILHTHTLSPSLYSTNLSVTLREWCAGF